MVGSQMFNNAMGQVNQAMGNVNPQLMQYLMRRGGGLWGANRRMQRPMGLPRQVINGGVRMVYPNVGSIPMQYNMPTNYEGIGG